MGKGSQKKKLESEMTDLENRLLFFKSLNLIPQLESFLPIFETLEQDVVRMGLALSDDRKEMGEFYNDLKTVKKDIEDFEQTHNLKNIIEQMYKLLGVINKDKNTLKDNQENVIDLIRALQPFAQQLKEKQVKSLLDMIDYYLRHSRLAVSGNQT